MTTLSLSLCSLLLGTGALPVFAEDTALVEAEDVSAALAELPAAKEVPGLVALAFQDGAIVMWGATGVRASGSKEPIRIDDPVHLGSCSKAMTATLIARFVENGTLQWTTTLAEAMPEFAKKVDPGFRDTTVEQFLKHRGGIAERRRPEIMAIHGEFDSAEGAPAEVREAVLARVMSKPPLAPPEDGFDYSNFGYMAAAAMLERKTGGTWSDLIEAHLFEPLGLDTAGVGSPTGPNAPVGHQEKDGGWVALPPGPEGVLPNWMGPAGLVHASLPDWARFVSSHLAGERGDEAAGLSPETYRLLHQGPNASPYAAGWALDHHTWSWGEGTVLTHNGSDGTWMSMVWAMPEWDLTIVVASNCAGDAGEVVVGEATELLRTSLGFDD